MAVFLSAFVMLTLLLGACDGASPNEAVVNVTPAGQEQNVEATPIALDENEAMTETLEADEAADTITSEVEADDVTVITSTELITGTEVTTDVTVMTDTAVLEQQLITTVITTTDVVTDVTESTDTSTTTESELITDTAELTPKTATGAVEADVDVTPLPPTPTPTVVVQVTRVVTDTQVVTDTVEVTAVATPQPGQTPQPQTEADAVAIVAFIGIEGATDRSIRASTLLDADFETVDGEVGGEIQDLVIDMQTGQILYVLLEYGGILDLGDTDMPVPLSVFRWGTEDQLILNIDGQRLENFPGVSNDWPVPDDDNWDVDVRNFWEGIGVDSGFDSAQAANNVRRASDLLDDPISDASFGEGTVEDMIIALGEGRVSYVLISLAGAGLGEDWYVIPMSAFDPSAPQDGLYLNADFDANLLEQAPRFDAAEFNQSGVFEEGYDNEWQSYWDDAGYPVQMGGDE